MRSPGRHGIGFVAGQGTPSRNRTGRPSRRHGSPAGKAARRALNSSVTRSSPLRSTSSTRPSSRTGLSWSSKPWTRQAASRAGPGARHAAKRDAPAPAANAAARQTVGRMTAAARRTGRRPAGGAAPPRPSGRRGQHPRASRAAVTGSAAAPSWLPAAIPAAKAAAAARSRRPETGTVDGGVVHGKAPRSRRAGRIDTVVPAPALHPMAAEDYDAGRRGIKPPPVAVRAADDSVEQAQARDAGVTPQQAR